ncbi:hypothetical protein SLA2020_274150 [Shorea laevis]
MEAFHSALSDPISRQVQHPPQRHTLWKKPTEGLMKANWDAAMISTLTGWAWVSFSEMQLEGFRQLGVVQFRS